jgi:hypothetical protein
MVTTKPGQRSRTFLVECYAPDLVGDDLEHTADRVRHASAALRDAGRRVIYLGAIVVPEDEVVFHLVRSKDSAAVREVCRRASIAFERVVETMVADYVPGSPSSWASSTTEPSLTRRASSVRERAPSLE